MYLQLAIRNLNRARLRSILAMIGIVIGVTAITSIGIFGDNLKRTVLESFGEIANELIITPNPKEGYKFVDEKDIETIKKSPYVSLVIPVKVDGFEIEYRGDKRLASVYGLDEESVTELFTAESGVINLKSGRVIAGKGIAEDLNLRVGDKIKINDRIYRVSAILEREGARFDINPNNALIIPSEEHPAEHTSVIVKVRSLEEIEDFKRYLDKTVNLKDKKIEVLELKSLIERIEEAFGQVNMFLMAIAGVSLLVAGVSILNIMLISTIERTKEIGIMRAIGARKFVILKIFLLEAMILGVSGSLIGSILSFLGGFTITKLILGDVSSIFSISTLLYMIEGFLFGSLTALISGFYPAWRASNLEPIEALRYE